ncbi:DUF6612 family protein [Ammoniphilus sp. CFH 90114]|uniref:DUF6612 family protein n=1 Tax=Ammoniphilus sp. CFH 90114 TaxID=2493665 RepID=UPI00100F19C1|nr:DUF6612 family protein [Ammoniphilus sp. CFH 90114]RXT04339.1 hypothetical protein EIZ39_20895 [Ammoniphilus sp. CFH 90114]
MKRRLLALSLSTTLLAGTFIGSGSVSANSTEQDIVTRGAFIHTIVDQLQLPLQDQNAVLPQDVSTDSPYAHAIRVMKERKVIYGYGDGTVRLENSLKANEAYIIIAKILGTNPEVLKNDYGISFAHDMVTLDEAKAAIQKALVSDPTAHEWVIKSSEVMDKQDSFKANMTQDMNMVLSQGLPEAPPMNTLNMTMKMEMEFKKDQGFRIVSNSKLPQPLTTGETEMKMEQYFVKDGMYMKMLNPETNQEEWMKMGSELPFTFDQMMEMQKNSVAYNQQMNNKYVFYRDLGTEVIDGKEMQKVSLQGRFTSMQEMLSLAGNLFSGQEMPAAMMEETGLEELRMSGFMWFDLETKLPTKLSMQMDLELAEMPNQPIERMEMKMSGTYTDFNQVDSIVLPEEAKQAKVIGAAGQE